MRFARQLLAARTVATLLVATLVVTLTVSFVVGCGPSGPTSTRIRVELSGPGWSLWLDEQAGWEQDVLHPPGVELSGLPAPTPTGGWQAAATGARPVVVPNTVEGELWAQVGDYRGVSWWSRELVVPPAASGRRMVLAFDAVRLRAQVYVDEQLVGYDAVGNTPFVVDLSGKLLPGVHRLAVRVTDPGGNFSWVDHTAQRWGEQTIPASHGFGGLTGPVRLEITDALHVADVFVASTPAVTSVVAHVELANPGPQARDVTLRAAVLRQDGSGDPLADASWQGSVPPGGTRISLPLDAPDAAPWSPADPRLYLCRVSLSTGDGLDTRFGFRWFAPDGVGADAVLRLNGRRIVLRSAISWGFWPRTGLVPSAELAQRQVRTAKTLGLNMLNHHRTIAAPGLLDVHDELGLLAYLEPGGYWSQEGDELCHQLARAKWLRMIARDRNHPSVVIYNMINESTDLPTPRHIQDLEDARRLDPTRLITYTSAWADDDEPRMGLHVRPGDPERYTQGWHDQHNAPGPGVWRDQFWNGPDDHRRRTRRRAPVVFWGEDGAIGAPPRLSLVADEVRKGPLGWDGADYLDWMAAYGEYLTAKGLTDVFPDLDALTASLGAVAHDYQARIIENVRLGDVADGYVINGWESELLENHSGIVDCWRHPKADPAILARANAPLMLAVKLRTKVTNVGRRFSASVAAPARVQADIYVVNEVDARGPHVLSLSLLAADGTPLWSTRREVHLSGGDVFGQPLLEGLELQIEEGPGRYRLQARLSVTEDGEVLVAGHDELLLVDWRGPELPGRGAAIDGSGRLTRFLSARRGVDLPDFHPGLSELDWVLVADTDTEPIEPVPSSALRVPDGEALGLLGRYRQGLEADAPLVLTRVDPTIEFVFAGESPAPGLSGPEYSVTWTGWLRPPESGAYRFHTLSAGGVRLWIDDQLVLDRWTEHVPGQDVSSAVELQAGREVALRLSYFQQRDASRLRLRWTRPGMTAQRRAQASDLVRRVADEGLTLVVLNEAESWARLLDELGAVRYRGKLVMGRYWMGGNFFAAQHPVLAGLPSGGALGWEYQELIHYAMPSYGLLLEGEEPVVACVSDHQQQLATALGVVRHGKGRILLSTLDIPAALPGPPGPRDLVGQLLVNIVRWAATGDDR